MAFPSNSPIQLTPNTTCGNQTGGNYDCGPSSTGTITLNKTPQQIQLTFNLYSDYIHYKNSLTSAYLAIPNTPTSPVSCPAGSTNLDYYRHFTLTVPVQQSATANCGDNTVLYNYYFLLNFLMYFQDYYFLCFPYILNSINLFNFISAFRADSHFTSDARILSRIYFLHFPVVSTVVTS